MKKMYQTPSEKVVKIQVTHIICGSGTVDNLDGNGDLNPVIGPGTGTGDSEPRSRMLDGWDDEY